jgi:D-glycero-D-manno-heptose 1,7-bisphosphate phosphatase
MKPVIGLDRDGVINVDLWDYCYKVEDFRLIPESLESIVRLKQAGYSVVIITNQAGISKGLYTEEDVNIVHNHLLNLLKEQGCPSIDGIYYSINKDDQNAKPNIGLFQQCERENPHICFNDGYFVGDKISDIQAAQNIGAKPILVRTGYGLYTEANMPLDGVIVFDRLSDFVDYLLQ